MSDNRSVLDFDEVRSVEVKLGGRTFSLVPQRAAIVERVLTISSKDTDRSMIETGPEDETSSTTVVERMFSNWDDILQATLLMFGYEEENAEQAAIKELFVKHLSPARAIKIFEKWWEVNEVDAFFERGGRVLMPIQTVEAIRKIRQETLLEEITGSAPGETPGTPATLN